MAEQPSKSVAKKTPPDKIKSSVPVAYSEELADKICEQIAKGDTLNTLDLDPAFPSRSTIQRWLARDEDFRARYEQAREERAEIYVEQLRDVLKDLREERIDANAARAAWNILSWLASKDSPRRYSDKIIHADPNNAPIAIQIIRFCDTPEGVIDVTPTPVPKAIEYANGKAS